MKNYQKIVIGDDEEEKLLKSYAIGVTKLHVSIANVS